MGSLLQCEYWQSSMWRTAFLHLPNENIQGRGWIKHSSLKNTLIVWKASMILMSDPPLPSHSVLNGFFFLLFLMGGTSFNHNLLKKNPSTVTVLFAFEHCLESKDNDPWWCKKRRKWTEKSEESIFRPLALVASAGKNWGQWICWLAQPWLSTLEFRKNSHEQRKPHDPYPIWLWPWDSQVKKKIPRCFKRVNKKKHVLLFSFKTGSYVSETAPQACYVAKGNLELLTFLPPSPQCKVWL